MPDLLASYEGVVLMAANVTNGHPWHRLGEQLHSYMMPAEALKVSGSDDVVIPATLYTLNDDGTYEEVEGYQAAKSNKYGTLGVHTPGYQIKQRFEILELAYDFTGLAEEDGQGAHIDTIGNIARSNSKPAIFFAYIRVPDLVIDPKGIVDTIERGLFVATSFDGSIPNIMGYSNIRVVCWNTLQMAMTHGSQIIKAKHTTNADERMKEAARALEYIGAVEKQVIENAEKMLQKDGDKSLDTLLNHFWPIDDEKLSDKGKARRLNERGDVRLLYEGEGNDNVALVGRNGWAAYNAFTKYIDHASGVKVQNANTQRAARAVLPGKWVDQKIKASELVLAS